MKKVYNEIGDKYERRRKNYKKYYKENDRLIAMSYQQHDEEEYDD